ncbi:hypothetical protein PHMEG_0004371 [Phytophthora megakarya]|uniref:Phosphoribosyltransferase domain-containing protein n=1 Tax=Phytophthora megakarya TaxID=4795 RepID=A0A225WVL0_9STRA|nr:hypothetical protein PHMEG_0004371 [Phytophthora megakarya]
MEPPPPTLPQLSSYLPTSSSDTRTSNMSTTTRVKKRRNSIEGTFSAASPSPPTPHELENEQLKRKKPPLEVSTDFENGSKAMSFSRLNSIYQAQEQGSPLAISKGFSFSSTLPSQDPDVSYFASRTTTPRRERTSRYLSEGDRREIITRIDAGEKQVTLAREFSVSRAAICNLYKNRWEVLTRGSRNPESKHPKKMRSKRSSPQLTPHTDESSAVTDPISVYPDVSAMSINAEQNPNDEYVGFNDSKMESSTKCRSTHEEEKTNQDRIPSMVQDSVRDDHSGHRHQSRHLNLNEADQISRSRDTASNSVTSRPFLVHEASAYSYACKNLVAALRDENISTAVFQQRTTRLVRLLIEEAFTCLPHEQIQIKNQFGDVCHATKSLDERDIFGVSMENNGKVLLRAFSSICPTSPTGVVSIESRTAEEPSFVHAQVPPVTPQQIVLLLDIECATGNEACAALQHLVHERQIAAKSIYFVTVISSFEGLQNVFRHFPDVTLIAAQVDTVLDADQHIRPGIKDFMQRYWNVHTDPQP